MKTIFLLAVASFFCIATKAQNCPDTLWTRTYGGESEDKAHYVRQTSDGGYVIAGETSSYGAGYIDFYLVKTNSQGDTLWTRSYGGPSNDKAYSVQQTADGGYILAGTTLSFHLETDIYLVRTDSSGDTLWTRTYGGNTSEIAISLQQTPNGDFVIAGYRGVPGTIDSDIFLMKIDSQGDSLWSRTYGGSNNDIAYSLQNTSDGGYVIAGSTNSFGAGAYDAYLIVTDSQGDTLWTRTFGGDNDENAYSVLQTTDGGFVLAGYTSTFTETVIGIYLVRTNSLGDSLWTCTLGQGPICEVRSICQATEGGFIAAGDSGTLDFGANLYVLKVDDQGDTLWTNSFEVPGDELANCIQQSADGGYIISGYYSPSLVDAYSVYMVKLAPDVQANDPLQISTANNYILFQCYPNPFNASTQITYELPRSGFISLSIHNLLGEQVTILADNFQTAGTHTVQFDGSTLSSGIYFARLVTPNQTATSKIVLIK